MGMASTYFMNGALGVVNSGVTPLFIPLFLDLCILPIGDTAPHTRHWFGVYTALWKMSVPTFLGYHLQTGTIAASSLEL